MTSDLSEDDFALFLCEQCILYKTYHTFSLAYLLLPHLLLPGHEGSFTPMAFECSMSQRYKVCPTACVNQLSCLSNNHSFYNLLFSHLSNSTNSSLKHKLCNYWMHQKQENKQVNQDLSGSREEIHFFPEFYHFIFKFLGKLNILQFPKCNFCFSYLFIAVTKCLRNMILLCNWKVQSVIVPGIWGSWSHSVLSMGAKIWMKVLAYFLLFSPVLCSGDTLFLRWVFLLQLIQSRNSTTDMPRSLFPW